MESRDLGGFENQCALGTPCDSYWRGDYFSGAAGFAVAVPAGAMRGIVALCAAAGSRVWSVLARNHAPPRAVFRPSERSLASASQTTIQRIGYAVGTAAAGIAANLAGLSEGSGIAAAKAAGFWVFAGFIPRLCLAVLSAWKFTSVVVSAGAHPGGSMTETNEGPSLPAWIQDHLSRYIATGGADGYLWDASLGGGKGLIPTLLLTTTGRKSGKVLTLPLIFGRSGPNYVVVASKGGAPAHPAWYLNLLDNPEVKVQVKAEKLRAYAHTADSAERAELWPMMVDIYGPYAQYQTKTDRQIPVVVLKPAA